MKLVENHCGGRFTEMGNLWEKRSNETTDPKTRDNFGFLTSHSREYVGEPWEKHVTETGNYWEK